MSNQKFYTVLEASRELKVTKPTVYDWLAKGKFPNATEAHEALRTILIPADDIEAMKMKIAQEKADEIKELGFSFSWGKESQGSNALLSAVAQ